MVEERFEREVTKIKDRRLKLQILKNRAEREGNDADIGSGLSQHDSRVETVATDRDRTDLDE
jgi:hypothetical protein